MKLDPITVAQNKRFWDSNESDYFGAKHAQSIYFLCREAFGKDILDAGAGDGSMIRALRKILPASNTLGVDLAPKSPDVLQGDLSNLPFEDHTFDTVLFMEVIEHLTAKDAHIILKEIERVLRPNGFLVLTTPFEENLGRSLVSCPNCNHNFHRYGHQHSFSEIDIINQVSEAGLNSVSIFPIKMNRMNRYKILGRKFFRTKYMQQKARSSNGKRNIICISKKVCD